MPQGTVPGRPCARISALLGTLSCRLSFAKSIFAAYANGTAAAAARSSRASLSSRDDRTPVSCSVSFFSCLARARSRTACSMAPRSGSSIVRYATSARRIAGAAASRNGTRHPNAGPTVPAMIWPSAMPAPVATVRTVATYARSFAGNKSPHTLKSRGKQPPTATPVSARVAKSCQYVSTQNVPRHGASPMATTTASRRTRGVLSASHPMMSDAGAPTTKNASCRYPPRYRSFSRSSKPNSSATAERLGESRF